MSILFMALNNSGDYTGGDTIWINLAKLWKAEVYCFQEGRDLYDGKRSLTQSPTILNIARNTITKLWGGVRYMPVDSFDYVYSVSDFLPDLIPAMIYKFRHKGCKWIAGYYLIITPSIYHGFSKVKGILYWLMQRATLLLVNIFADVVYVTSEPDRKYFPHKKVVVIRGGVDMQGTYNSKDDEKVYDAVFVGRFHYQKGVIELVDIWNEVCKKKPTASLAMVGDGPLYQEVYKAIVKFGLKKNITLTGFLVGQPKHSLLMSSRVFVHPSIYDSGGMACAEGMAWGLPAVGFNLECFKTYYPKGMLKSKDNKEFAENIIQLLDNQDLYDNYSKQAHELVEEDWEWSKQSERIWRETSQD